MSQPLGIRATAHVVVLGVVFGFALMALPVPLSGDWTWPEGWALAAVSGIGFIAARYLAARRNPDLISERTRVWAHPDTKAWDKVLAPLVAFGLPAVGIVAGVEHGSGPSAPLLAPWLRWTALALLVGVELFAYWALLVNRFFSTVVRIQSDRGHCVVSSGPYAIVRHPGYAGTLLVYLLTPVVLGSVWALAPAVFFAAVLLLRTALEDRTLRAELPGYADYARKTRFRLLPGVW